MTSQPQTIGQLQDLVRGATRVRVRGGGTKSSFRHDAVDLASLRGIVEYSPDECVFTALAGTPVREIREALARHGQYLPFDPPFADEGATIGGTVASGVNGPLRYRYGGVRDFLIGVRVVDGEGRLIRSGGKVVKNAAGFLLHHGIVGSWGRFGVVAEVTFKVFPAPEARETLTVACDDVEDAFETAQRVEAMRCDCEAIDFDERGILRVTIAGRQAAISERAARLFARLRGTVPEGRIPEAGTVPQVGTVPDLVKVAGVMNSWQQLRPHVVAAHFVCAGAVAWLSASNLPALERALNECALVGQVICGPRAGERIGRVRHNEFEERVRRVLDPHDKFSAAPHPHH